MTVNKSSFYRALGLGAKILLVFLIAVPAVQAANSDSGAIKEKAPDTFTSWMASSKITGQFREYYYTADFQNILPYRHTNSAGGWLNFHTPDFKGFSLDVGVYTAQDVFNGNTDKATQIQSLPSEDLTVLGQAYIQYQGYGLKLRAGNQPLQTPFAMTNGADWRMIPPLYQGVGGSYDTPVKGLSLHGYRIFRFKGVTDSDFTRRDTGSPSNFNFIAPAPVVESTGFYTLGAKQKYGNSTGQLWFYHFYDRANLAYASYDFPLDLGNPYVKKLLLSAQYASEWDVGNHGGAYQDVNSDLYGLRAGFVLPYHTTLFLSYNGVATHSGSFRSGGFVDPYGQGNYNTPTVYTDILGASLGGIQGTPGDAFSIKGVIKIPKYNTMLIPIFTNVQTPNSLEGSNGTSFAGTSVINAYQFIGKYKFGSSGWATQVLYSNINQSRNPLGRIQLLRFYVTYDLK